MISLRAMSESEYTAYVAYFIPDYAEEIAKNYELSFEHAEDQAKLEMQNALPQGLNTDGQVLLSVVLTRSGGEKVVGSFWYKPDFVAKSAFVYDFYMLPSWQGKGMGREALAVLEDRLAGEGLMQIKLRVAADNKRAKHVYDSTGFRVTGINMMKKIGNGH